MPSGPDSTTVELPPAEDKRSSTPRGRQALWVHHGLLSAFVFIWGGNFILAEVALRELTPISFSVSRFLVGGGALLVLLYWQYSLRSRRSDDSVRIFPSVRRKDWPRLLLVSVLGATLAPWLGIEGLELTHGARASLWLALGPALSAGIGYLLLTERIGKFGYVGIVLAGGGTVALAIDGVAFAGTYWAGDILLFLALLCAVVELHLIGPLVVRYGAVPVVAARTAIGGLIYFLIAAPSLVQQPWLHLSAWTWIAILAGGAIGVGLGQWVKYRALKAIDPTRVVIYGNLVPLATLWLAWTTIGTIPSAFELVAAPLIVLGAVCLQVLDVPARR